MSETFSDAIVRIINTEPESWVLELYQSLGLNNGLSKDVKLKIIKEYCK